MCNKNYLYKTPKNLFLKRFLVKGGGESFSFVANFSNVNFDGEQNILEYVL